MKWEDMTFSRCTLNVIENILWLYTNKSSLSILDANGGADATEPLIPVVPSILSHFISIM